MRCRTCNHDLWNVRERVCPECATPFLPSDFTFERGRVNFCCPHCDLAYLGTGERGQLSPRRFNCQGCARTIDMDEMIVRPVLEQGVHGAVPAPISPPISPGAVSQSTRPSVWPTVVGIIFIVLGAGGTLSGLWGIASSGMMSMFKGFTPPGAPNPFEALAKWMVPLAILSGISAAVAAILLLGGIALVRRLAWSRPTLLSWAVIKMIVAVGVIAITAAMQYDMMTSMSNQMSAQATARGGPGPPPGLFAAMSTFTAVITAVFGLLWHWSLPIFALIWLTRRNVREEIASWQRGPARG